MTQLKQRFSKEINFSFKKNLMLLFFLGITFGTFAQTSFKGKVTDEKGEPVIGASIKVKGTSLGTITDFSGVFNLNVNGKEVLVISYVGYASQEISVTGKSNISVQLKEDQKALDEVVVVGYGTQKKATLTGAVSQVGAEAFKDKPVTNAALALQGEIPGLMITRGSSRPGNENISIRLRGESSVASVDPLIIIDGVPVMATWEINQLNPQDIESVSTLKDASAAIYGARAQGGVILITTKRGKSSGKMKVTYNGNFAVNTVANKTPFVGSMKDFGDIYYNASMQDKVDANGNAVQYTPQWGLVLDKFRLGVPFNYKDASGNVTHYQSNDWFDQLYGPSTTQQHSVSLAGGSDKVTYRASFGYSDAKSVLKTAYDGEKKYNVRFNSDIKITDKLKFENSIAYDRRIVSTPYEGVDVGYGDAPVFASKDSLGYDSGPYDYPDGNPVLQTKSGGRKINTDGFVRLNGKLSYEIIKGLVASGTVGIVQYNGTLKSYQNVITTWNWLHTVSHTYPGTNKGGITQKSYGNLYQTYGGFLNYNKTIAKDHNIAAMVGMSSELNDTEELDAYRDNLLYSNFGLYTLSTAENNTATNTNSSSASHWGLASYIGRFNYDYKSKYLLEFVGRRDGSSKFATGHKWSNFGGASAGWRITQEDFLQDNRILSDLKLKAGYGETGGQANIGNYDFTSAVSTGTAAFGTTSALQQTASQSGLTSFSRTWERMINYNIGVDFGLFDNKLSGSISLYKKKNHGMLIDVTYPQLLGASAPKSNSGELSVKGWEFTLNWKDKIGDFNYNVGVILSDDRNNLDSYVGKDVVTPGKNALRQGYPLNSLFVYKTAGYFQKTTEISSYYATYGDATGNLASVPNSGGTAGTRLRLGDLNKVDLNGDSKITTDDVYYYGDANPHYLFGVNLGASYKNFDFGMFLQGVGQQYILRTGSAQGPLYANYQNVLSSFIGKTWTPDNTDAQYPRLSMISAKNKWNYDYNDVNVQNLRYVRCKSLVVGYSIPKNLLNNLKIERLRVYFSGNDLFEFSSVKDGFDPERGENSNSLLPFTRTWSLGLDINF